MKITLLLIVLAALSILATLYYQGQQEPRKNSPYVALGSSFAAGIGLGDRVSGSPLVCLRSMQGYPRHVARETGLSLTDMSCSGATTQHVLRGGQVFLGPQIDALGPDTQLVTLTIGGNDIGYVGDLTFMAFRNRGGFTGALAGLVWHGAKPAQDRNFSKLQRDLVASLREIKRRAPKARVFVVPYPAILPESDTCAKLGIDDHQAAVMRSVGLRLFEVTRAAVQEAGATFVDLTDASTGHNACAAEPWVNGSAPASGAAFHPTLEGAKGVAAQIMTTFNEEFRK
ncbi:MAG: SGNH/GDSL hydrolase family protein [Sphingorhabdus sp.]|nr:SGNH/GDSL hydrolase family protein [Sphingorhabdus sp.]